MGGAPDTSMQQPQGDMSAPMGHDGGGQTQDGQQPERPDGKSEFDTGFDAGVEADEDEDPKKFIQQLTGKLSQALNKYNNENGDDKELSKYVGKMIAKSAAKGLDDNGKKDLIKAINTTDGDDGGDNTEPDADMQPQDDGGDNPNETELMDGGEEVQEAVFSKADIRKMLESINAEVMNGSDEEESEDNEPDKPKDNGKKNTPFTPKNFNK